MPLSNQEHDLNPYKEDIVTKANYAEGNKPAQQGSAPGQTNQPSPAGQPQQAEKKPGENQPRKTVGGFDAEKLRILLIKLAKAYKRHHARWQAHSEFHDHVDQIKSNIISARPKKTYKIDGDIHELKKRVANLIEIEKNPHYHTHNKEMQEKIAMLEDKLNRLMKSKEEREKRFAELDKKVSLKLTADKQIMDELEKKLLVIQKKIIQHKMKKKSKKHKEELNLLNDRLELTKNALHKIKENS